MLGDMVEINLFASLGRDETGRQISALIKEHPGLKSHIRWMESISPHTYVLSDPGYNEGQGERTFINHMGAAAEFFPSDLDESFYESDILLFGGTGLVPGIHDSLDDLLTEAKNRKRITLVNTIYDFRNEKLNPGKPWPLGSGHRSLPWIDILIMDHEESLKISGMNNSNAAMEYFIEQGTGTVIITNGANPVLFYSDGRIFKPESPSSLPVSGQILNALERYPEKRGDTTGCGDNFVGGVLVSLIRQLTDKDPGNMSLPEAINWGSVSGGFACFYNGGVYQENEPGEKRALLRDFLFTTTEK
jgi:sugar/nucleoside kinase (ribokinase family)